MIENKDIGEYFKIVSAGLTSGFMGAIIFKFINDFSYLPTLDYNLKLIKIVPAVIFVMLVGLVLYLVILKIYK